MIKVSDYIIKRLVELGVRDCFMVSGGAAMHLDDSIGRAEGMNYVCCHHEQACAMAAEGYARVAGRPALVCVTSGPGGTNAITGVAGQWTDSVPAIYLSGQVRKKWMNRTPGLRQLGDQELDIISLVRPVTKFSAVLEHPEDARYLVEKAFHKAARGRPGPVWLDVPLDVQQATIDETELYGFMPAGPYQDEPGGPDVTAAVAALQEAKRPVIVAGHGTRIANAREDLLRFINAAGIPVVTTFNGMDLVPSDHPLFVGRAGTIGTYSGNWAIQNADLVLFIGTRNNPRQTGFEPELFAAQAKKVVVDIDAQELWKDTLKPDILVHADAGAFLRELQKAGDIGHGGWKEWLAECRSQMRSAECGVRSAVSVDPGLFVETLTSEIPDDAIIVSGNGTASVALHQAGMVKDKTRVIMNSGMAAMGYDLPATIGACIANDKKPVVCITGDGSIQMNIQELQTIAHYNLPVKIFVLDNGGYSSIRQTQDRYFEGRHVGSDAMSGVSCPDVLKLGAVYFADTDGSQGYIGDQNQDYKEVFLAEILNAPEISVCNVEIDPDYVFNKIDIPSLAEARV